MCVCERLCVVLCSQKIVMGSYGVIAKTVMVVVLWSLWKSRSKACFEKIIPLIHVT
jgi:hypothetical protein